jgi:hypothetical protein
MVEPGEGPRSSGGYIVLREVEDGHWYVVGDVHRRSGLTAKASRVQAVQDATNGTASEHDVFACVPRSEWRVARQL